MPILQVLIDDKGEVIGSARTDVGGGGSGAPERTRVVARPGQRLIEVAVDDEVAHVDPAALHATIKARYLK